MIRNKREVKGRKGRASHYFGIPRSNVDPFSDFQQCMWPKFDFKKKVLDHFVLLFSLGLVLLGSQASHELEIFHCIVLPFQASSRSLWKFFWLSPRKFYRNFYYCNISHKKKVFFSQEKSFFSQEERQVIDDKLWKETIKPDFIMNPSMKMALSMGTNFSSPVISFIKTETSSELRMFPGKRIYGSEVS